LKIFKIEIEIAKKSKETRVSIHTHLWTETLEIVTHGSLFGLNVSLLPKWLPFWLLQMWNYTCLYVLDTKSDEFTVTVIYLYSTVVLLVHLTLVVIEKATYIWSKKCRIKVFWVQNTIFCQIYWVRIEIHVWQFQVFEFTRGYGCWPI